MIAPGELFSCPHYCQGTRRSGTDLQRNLWKWAGGSGGSRRAKPPCSCKEKAKQVCDSGMGHQQPQGVKKVTRHIQALPEKSSLQVITQVLTIIAKDLIWMGLVLDFAIGFCYFCLFICLFVLLIAFAIVYLARNFAFWVRSKKKGWGKNIFTGMGMREFNSLVYAIWISSFYMCICVNLMKIFCLKDFIQGFKKKTNSWQLQEIFNWTLESKHNKLSK